MSVQHNGCGDRAINAAEPRSGFTDTESHSIRLYLRSILTLLVQGTGFHFATQEDTAVQNELSLPESCSRRTSDVLRVEEKTPKRNYEGKETEQSTQEHVPGNTEGFSNETD